MMKKGILFFVALIYISMLVGCSPSASVDIAKIDREETYPEAPGQLNTEYEDVQTIAADAAVIVEISVDDQKVVMLDGYPQTHTIVNVHQVYQGDIDIGDFMEVVEEGGYDGKVMGGLPLLSKENKYVLFLNEYKGYYYICGAFQGRFIEREGYLFQQATADVKLDTYSPLSITDFSAELIDLIEKNTIEK